MVLAALSIAEELFEVRNANSELENSEEVLMERVNHSLKRLLTEIKE
jgi:cell division protein ZapA